MKNWLIIAFMACSSLLMGDPAHFVPPEPPADQGLTQTLVMIGIMGLFFYLILWRPEQKRRKELEEQRAGIQKGDRVNAMGIVGTVSKVQEETVILKMVDGGKIEFLKAAINEVHSSQSDEEKSE